jgi:hypothetical protein
MSGVVEFPVNAARQRPARRVETPSVFILPIVRAERVEENQPVIPFCMCCGKPLYEEENQ